MDAHRRWSSDLDYYEAHGTHERPDHAERGYAYWCDGCRCSHEGQPHIRVPDGVRVCRVCRQPIDGELSPTAAAEAISQAVSAKLRALPQGDGDPGDEGAA